MTVAYIFVRYPDATQTFLRREINALRVQGLRVEIYSLENVPPRERPDAAVSYFRWHELVKLIVALPRELWRDPALARDAWRLLRKHAPASLDNLMASVRAAAFALCRAEEFRRNKPRVVHGVWATGPATAAAVLSRLCGMPFTFGGHAYDIYRHGGDTFLESKLCAAAFVHTTTEANVHYLKSRAPSANIVLARRGLERMPELNRWEREAGPIRILSVGRLVSKKGHTLQVAALAELSRMGLPFEARIVGDGPLRDELQAAIDRASLGNLVTLCGALPEAEVDTMYRWADVFWHTGIVAADGDRDGLPNVIPEAFAHELPVICGHSPGATEAVEHEMNGLVVDIADHTALAAAVQRLAKDAGLRQRFGENGRCWVEEHFLVCRNVEILARAFHDISRP